MAPVRQSPKFGEWLAGAVQESGLKKREIARRMAAKHPAGVNTDTIETARRTINKILNGMTPTQPTRDSIAEALGRDDAPSVANDDDEEDDLQATLLVLARASADLNSRINRALRTVGQ